MKDILATIGNTPLLELKNLNVSSGIKIFVKVEGFNPGGSIKDRPALYMLTKAEENGKLTKDKTVLEPTSGNTGIAIAMIGAMKGYRVTLTMPECVSIERRRILEAYGANVVLTPGEKGTDGAIIEAHKMVKESPGLYFMPNQFENENNPLAHYETTGPEVFEQTKGEIDYFVAGMGTTGTLMGISKYFKENKPEVKIIGVEPTLGHRIQGLKNMAEAIMPKIYCPDLLDDKVTVEDDDAYEMARYLVRSEGLFCGMSSGAALVGALNLAKKIKNGIIVVILPDRGERYLSTTLFRAVCAKCPP